MILSYGKQSSIKIHRVLGTQYLIHIIKYCVPRISCQARNANRGLWHEPDPDPDPIPPWDYRKLKKPKS